MDTSPFSKLPAELRIAIYELALIEPDGIELGFTEPIPYTKNCIALKPLPRVHLSRNLLITCKEIRHEALPIFLANRFTVELAWAHPNQAELIAAWVMAYGSDALLIKNLKFNCTDRDDFARIGHFAKRFLHLLKPLSLRPSIPAIVDMYDIVIYDDNPHDKPAPVHIDYGKQSAAENGRAVLEAVKDLTDYVRSDDFPFGFPNLFHYEYWNGLVDDKETLVKRIDEAGERVSRFIDRVQGGERST